MNLTQPLLASLVLSALPLAAVIADRPPADAKPLSVLVAQLEKAGYGPIVELSFDDGRLEVEAYKQDTGYELKVDPRSGKVLSEERDNHDERPPQDAQPLSAILAKLEKAGYTKISDVSFERRYWEIEAVNNQGERELHVDPNTGEILREKND